FLIATNRRETNMHENKNEHNAGTKTIKKIEKANYEVIVHFNENATETMQDKLKRIMLREMEREKDKKPHKND
ncbi:transposon-encoded TnpW family protein, partial [Peptostreptococcus anaerobius]